MEVGDPASVPSHQDVALLVEAGRFGSLEHDPLVENLHGVDALRMTQFDDAHLSERSATDHLDDLKVVPR